MIKQIKVGIAGLGRAGWGMHCAELDTRAAKFKIVAACDPIEDRRSKMQQRYGCATYADFESLIADPEVELVDIATRTRDHYQHAVAALQAGKQVLLEKPMCATYAEAQKLAAAAAESSGGLFVRHNRRFDPDFLQVLDLIDSGVLGDVFELRLARHSYHRRDDWQTLKEHAGGQLLNWGPHIIDHALRFLASPVQSQYGYLRRVTAVGDAEDHVKIVLRGASGRVVDLEISGGVALPNPRYQVFGSLGTAIVQNGSLSYKHLDSTIALSVKAADPGTPGTSFGTAEQLPWQETTVAMAGGDNYVIWDHLYAAIRDQTPFPVSTAQALEVMRVISETKRGTEF